MTENAILLNAILKFENLENVRIRFNLMFDDNWNPTEILNKGNKKL